MGVIYRVASTVAQASGPVRVRWYRRGPLDATLFLGGKKTVGILRQGVTSDRTGLSKRVWRLLEGPAPDALLVLAPDPVRLRYTMRLMDRSHSMVLVAQERHAALAEATDRVWRLRIGTAVSLDWALPHISATGDALPAERPEGNPSRAPDLALPQEGLKAREHLLPALLKPGEKRVMDLLADWPWITAKELSSILGVSSMRVSQLLERLLEGGLVTRTAVGRRRPLALTDSGLGVLARRDRTSVGRMRRQWSTESDDDSGSADWRNFSGRRSRLLARNMEHTEAVHRFLARLTAQAKAQGVEVLQVDPPHRASRHFWHGDRLRSIHPRRLRHAAQGRRDMALSSWSGSAARCAPAPWPTASLPTCATTPPTGPPTITAPIPWCSWSSTTTSRRPGFTRWPATRCPGHG